MEPNPEKLIFLTDNSQRLLYDDIALYVKKIDPIDATYVGEYNVRDVIERVQKLVEYPLHEVFNALFQVAWSNGFLHVYKITYEIRRQEYIGEAEAYVVKIEWLVTSEYDQNLAMIYATKALNNLKKKYPQLSEYSYIEVEKKENKYVGWLVIKLPIATKEFESLLYSALASPTIESPTVETEEVKDEDIEEILDRLYMPILPPDVLAKLREELNKVSQTPPH